MRGIFVLVVVLLGLSSVAVAEPLSIAECKKLPDGAEVSCDTAVVTAAFPSCFYVEQMDRACGIRVEYAGLYPSPWRHVRLDGTLLTDSNGERYVLASQLEALSESTELGPLWLRNRDLGGGDWFFDASKGSGQRGIAGSWGLNNVGLLVSVCGAVTGMQSSWVEIGDGSGQPVKVVLPEGMSADQRWRYVSAAGICSLEKLNDVVRPVVLVRSASDISPVVESVSAVIAARPEHPAPGQQVELDGRVSLGRIATYEWDTDYDGTTFNADQTGPKVNVSFERFGVYTVALRVTPESSIVPGDTATQVITVDQGNLLPVADAGGPYYVGGADSVVLNGTGSHDPNAQQGDRIVNYEWDLDGDGAYDAGGELPVVSWAQILSLGLSPGTHEVSLRVTDSFGVSATGSATLLIFQSSAPVASFVCTPETAAPGQVITLDATSSYHPMPNKHIVSYQWDFDSDGSYDAEGVTASFTPQAFGDYKVTLKVKDDSAYPLGVFAYHVISVSLGNHPPVAETGGPYSINLGQVLALDGSGSWDPDVDFGDRIALYLWDLTGNGSYDDARGATPVLGSWQYPPLGAGVHTVGLKVIDSFGVASTASTQLTIYYNAPTAEIAASPNPTAPGYPVTLDGSGSSHDRPDRHIVSWDWDLDNDGAFDDASGVEIKHTFKDEGSYLVRLRVTDDNTPPKTATASTKISVISGNIPPVADAGKPYDIVEGTMLKLDGGGSYEPDLAHGDMIVKYEWDLDGDFDFSDAAGVSPSLTWAMLQQFGLGVGTHEVTLRVTDTHGATGTDSESLVVYENNPVASLVCTPPSVSGCGQGFVFDGSASYHTYPARSIVQYEWDFDSDGKFDATGPVVVHAYPQIGVHTVTLKVTDDNYPARTDTATIVVTVEPVSPPHTDPGGPYQINVGDPLYVDGSLSTDPDVSCGDMIVNYAWDVNGDGSYDSSAPYPSLSLSWAQLQSLLQAAGYGEPVGRFQVRLRVTDTTGRTHSAAAPLDIYLNEPVADLETLVTSVAPDQEIVLDGSASYHGSPMHSIVSYEWDLDGDGVYDRSGETILDNFDRFGVYDVTLRVVDDQGKSDTAVVTIAVDQGNLPPVANPGGPYVVGSGSELALDASLSYDMNEPAGDGIVSYLWDLDGDGVFDDASGEHAVVSWAVLEGLGQGDHIIRLRVTDGFGAVGESFTRLEIR